MTINFRKIFFTLYAALFTITPLLMFHKTSEIFEFNKMIYIYGITLLIGVFWIIRMTYARSIILKKTPFDIPILLFVISQIIATIFSIDRHTSLFGYYGRFNGGLLSILSYTILYYGFVTHLAGPQIKRTILTLLKVSIITSFFVVIWAIPGIFGYDLSCLLFAGKLYNGCWTENFRPAERIFSTLGQPNWLGAYLAVNFFFGLYFFITEKAKFVIHRLNIDLQKLWGLYLVVATAGLYFTHSRSSFVGLFVGFAFFFLFFLYDSRYRQKISIVPAVKLFVFPIILVCMLGIVLVGLFRFPERINKKEQARVSSTASSNVTDSFTIRTIVWKGALQLGLRNPLFGTGPETFGYSYYLVRPPEHNLTSEWDFLYNKAHNEYLHYIATTGFIGFGMYILLIVMVYRYGLIAYREHPENILLILSILAAYTSILVTNFFGFSTSTINLFFYLIPALILFTYTPVHQAAPLESITLDRTKNNIPYFLSGTLLGIIGGVFLITYFIADILYAQALSLQAVQRYDQAFTVMQIAYRMRPEHVYADKLSTLAAQSAVLTSYTPDGESITSQLIDFSDVYIRKAQRESPKNVLYVKSEARNQYLFYQITNEEKYFTAAVRAIERASKLAPTDPKLYYTHAFFIYSRHSGQKKHTAKTIKQLKEIAIPLLDSAIALKKNYRDAYLLKGQILSTIGQKSAALKQFRYILMSIDPHDEKTQTELEKLQ